MPSRAPLAMRPDGARLPGPHPPAMLGPSLTASHRLERSQHVPRPLGEVFAFFTDAANLEELTPDFLHFRILTPKPIVMRAGTLIDYQLRLFGVPFRWRTRIETFDP